MGDPGLGGGGGPGWNLSDLPGQQCPDDLDPALRPHLHPDAAAARLRPLLRRLQRLWRRPGLFVRDPAEGSEW